MTPSDPLQRGFNAGYQLQQHAPALADQLQASFIDKNHPYVQGFDAGRAEFQKEQTLSHSHYLDRQLQRARNHHANKSDPTTPQSQEPGFDL